MIEFKESRNALRVVESGEESACGMIEKRHKDNKYVFWSIANLYTAETLRAIADKLEELNAGY